MNGNFELNVYLPVIADALLASVELLANGARTFDRCVQTEANQEACEQSVERTLVYLAAPALGYDKAAAISKEPSRQPNGSKSHSPKAR